MCSVYRIAIFQIFEMQRVLEKEFFYRVTIFRDLTRLKKKSVTKKKRTFTIQILISFINMTYHRHYVPCLIPRPHTYLFLATHSTNNTTSIYPYFQNQTTMPNTADDEVGNAAVRYSSGGWRSARLIIG